MYASKSTKVHYSENNQRSSIECCAYINGQATNTTDPKKVTCGNCRRTEKVKTLLGITDKTRIGVRKYYRVTHWQHRENFNGVACCNFYKHRSTDIAKVDCESCKNTIAYKKKIDPNYSPNGSGLVHALLPVEVAKTKRHTQYNYNKNIIETATACGEIIWNKESYYQNTIETSFDYEIEVNCLNCLRTKFYKENKKHGLLLELGHVAL